MARSSAWDDGQWRRHSTRKSRGASGTVGASGGAMAPGRRFDGRRVQRQPVDDELPGHPEAVLGEDPREAPLVEVVDVAASVLVVPASPEVALEEAVQVEE